MRKEFYIIENNVSAGPFSIPELGMKGITGDTFVWTQGMSDWAPAREVSELRIILAPDKNESQGQWQGGFTPPPHNGAQPGYGASPVGGQPPYSGFSGTPIPPVSHTNWLPWAIVATVVGFMFSIVGGVLGILGIVNANKANSYYEVGNNVMGDRENSSAKTMTIVALALSGFGLLTTIGYFSLWL